MIVLCLTTTLRKSILVTEFETLCWDFALVNFCPYLLNYARDFIFGQLKGQGQNRNLSKKSTHSSTSHVILVVFLSQASLWYVGALGESRAVHCLSRPADIAGHQRLHVTHAAPQQFYSEFNANHRNQIWWSKYSKLTEFTSLSNYKINEISLNSLNYVCF